VSPRPRRKGTIVFMLIGCFYAGVLVGWILHAAFSPATVAHDPETPVATAGRAGGDAPPPKTGPAAAATASTPPAATPHRPSIASDPVAALKKRALRLPIDEADVAKMKGSFAERRGGGARGHEAVDILAPRNTPIHAVDEGTIAKLFTSAAGGITVYQFDRSGEFCYYYAHLERYASGLRDGQAVERGQVIGYVGTTGNAPPNTPHLHFAVFELTEAKQWWNGTPIDPYLLFARD
jgi:murein DD-endopeptidase MepM/ murein hydrolase activator NlpD